MKKKYIALMLAAVLAGCSKDGLDQVSPTSTVSKTGANSQHEYTKEEVAQFLKAIDESKLVPIAASKNGANRTMNGLGYKFYAIDFSDIVGNNIFQYLISKNCQVVAEVVFKYCSADNTFLPDATVTTHIDGTTVDVTYTQSASVTNSYQNAVDFEFTGIWTLKWTVGGQETTVTRSKNYTGTIFQDQIHTPTDGDPCAEAPLPIKPIVGSGSTGTGSGGAPGQTGGGDTGSGSGSQGPGQGVPTGGGGAGPITNPQVDPTDNPHPTDPGPKPPIEDPQPV